MSAVASTAPELARNLSDDRLDQINAQYQKIVESETNTLQHAIALGELIVEDKGHWKHGEWTARVHDRYHFSIDAVQDYMRLANNKPLISGFSTMHQALEHIKAEKRRVKAAAAPATTSTARAGQPATAQDPDEIRSIAIMYADFARILDGLRPDTHLNQKERREIFKFWKAQWPQDIEATRH